MSSTASIPTEKLQLLLEITRSLAVTADLDPLLLRMVEAATSLLGCERASIWVYDPRTQELWTRVALGSGQIRMPSSRGIAGAAFTTNRIVDVPDPYSDPRFNPEADRRSGFRTRNILAAPLVDLEGRPLGVVQALNKHGGSFAEVDAAMIQLLGDQAGVALQRHRLQQEAMITASLKREMLMAKKLQEGLIPRRCPEFAPFKAAGYNRSASVTGGDTYDLWITERGDLGILLADASGHGMDAALVISQTRALIRALLQVEDDPLSVLKRTTARLQADLEAGRFATAFLGLLSRDGTLRWANAGHGPVLVRGDARAAFRELETTMTPLGVDGGEDPEPPSPVTIAEGGMILLATDGIHEAMDSHGEQWDVARLLDTVQQKPGDSPEAIISDVLGAVGRWQQGSEPADDQTLIVISRSVPKPQG